MKAETTARLNGKDLLWMLQETLKEFNLENYHTTDHQTVLQNGQ